MSYCADSSLGQTLRQCIHLCNTFFISPFIVWIARDAYGNFILGVFFQLDVTYVWVNILKNMECLKPRCYSNIEKYKSLIIKAINGTHSFLFLLNMQVILSLHYYIHIKYLWKRLTSAWYIELPKRNLIRYNSMK